MAEDRIWFKCSIKAEGKFRMTCSKDVLTRTESKVSDCYFVCCLLTALKNQNKEVRMLVNYHTRLTLKSHT
jgi:hypothetical protein